MRFFRLGLAILLFAVSATAAAPSRRNASAPCVRPPARQMPDGATIVLSETARFPCTLQFVNTGLVLRVDPAGKVEDIGSSVSRGPDGRLYTSNGRSGQVTVWNADGSFQRNFGSPGAGPGEFGVGGKVIFFDQNGRLIIGTNNRLLIYSTAYDFVAAVPPLGNGIYSGALLADGNFLSARGATDAAFRIVDLNQQSNAQVPRILRSFGPARSSGYVPGKISYSGGTTFWAGPENGIGLGYVLDLWRTNGTHVRTIRRDVPWMPRGIGATTTGRLPPPEMEVMHEDGTGLVFVAMMVPNSTFLTLSASDRQNPDPNGPVNNAIDIYLEVIDANAGVVLASAGPIHPSEAIKQIPTGFFAGSRQGYRREEDSNGFGLMRIVEYQLIAR